VNFNLIKYGKRRVNSNKRLGQLILLIKKLLDGVVGVY